MRLIAFEAPAAGTPDDPRLRELTIYDLSADGFLIDAAPHWAVGDRLSFELAKVGTVAAQIVRADRDMFGCALARPLSSSQLDLAMAASKVVWPDFPAAEEWRTATADRMAAKSSSIDRSLIGDDWDETERWPRPVRAGIIVGGGLALWGLIALAFW